MPFANPNLSNVDNIFFTQRSLSLDRVAPGTDLAGYPGNIFAGIRYGRLNINIDFFFRKKCTFL